MDLNMKKRMVLKRKRNFKLMFKRHILFGKLFNLYSKRIVKKNKFIINEEEEETTL